MERPFFVEEEAILHLDPLASGGEARRLDAFDRHRDRICAIAARVYGRGHQGSYTLTWRDFT
jgi:Protein of unknown function (DUF1488)